MGLIDTVLGFLFGGGRNVVKETMSAFRETPDQLGARATRVQVHAMQQHGREFQAGPGVFNRFMDGVNRLPRPALALGTLALFISAMTDPVWFSERMQGLALVPEPLWWLLGVIVSFYFGARHQIKNQQFQRELAQTMARVPQVVENIETLREMRAEDFRAADTGSDAALTLVAAAPEENAALTEWQKTRAAA